MEDCAGYVKDVKSGALIPISKKNLLDEIERNNKTLIQQRKAHLITHEVVVPKVLQKKVEVEEIEVPKVKVGRIKK